MVYAEVSRVEILSYHWWRKQHYGIYPSLSCIFCGRYKSPEGDNKVDQGTYSLSSLYKMMNTVFWKQFHGHDEHATAGQYTRGMEENGVLLCILILILKYPLPQLLSSVQVTTDPIVVVTEKKNRFKIWIKIWFCHLVKSCVREEHHVGTN